jgi:uncharacterized protein (UPF0179 family)
MVGAEPVCMGGLVVGRVWRKEGVQDLIRSCGVAEHEVNVPQKWNISRAVS